MRSNIFLASLGVAGSAIIVGQLTATSQRPAHLSGGTEFVELSNGDPIYDVDPCRISTLQQFGAMGSFPTGTAALGLSTTGHNNGNVKLPWYESPDVHHPVIAQNMYRVNAEGRLEQIGLAWLKHAWFALQQSNCGSCIPHDDGTELGVGCADTYGAGLNAQQYWLGPRWEVRPNAHAWMDGFSWNGSHFGRNAEGGDSGSHNAVEHRLRVQMGDLTTSGATYFYEAVYYLLKDYGDEHWLPLDELPEHMFNNARHRGVRPTRNGNSFSFAEVGASVNGPLVWQWGDTQSVADTGAWPDDDGVLYVSSRSVDLGNGRHRYEYAVMNLSVDREIAGVAIPIGGTITNVAFHAPKDGYWNASGVFVNESPYDVGNWLSEVSGGSLNFVPPTPGNGLEPNAIRYGTLYTYWFTSDRAPATNAGTMVLTPRLAGDILEYTADVVVPQTRVTAADLEAVDIVVGTIRSGGLPELEDSDDDILETRSGFGRTVADLHNMTMDVAASTDSSAPLAIRLTIESRVSDQAGQARVSLLNQSSGEFDQVGTYAIGNQWSVRTFEGIDAEPYVGSGGEIVLRVKHIVIMPFFSYQFNSLFDQVLIEIVD